MRSEKYLVCNTCDREVTDLSCQGMGCGRWRYIGEANMHQCDGRLVVFGTRVFTTPTPPPVGDEVGQMRPGIDLWVPPPTVKELKRKRKALYRQAEAITIQINKQENQT